MSKNRVHVWGEPSDRDIMGDIVSFQQIMEDAYNTYQPPKFYMGRATFDRLVHDGADPEQLRASFTIYEEQDGAGQGPETQAQDPGREPGA